MIICAVLACASLIACSLIIAKPNLLFRRAGGISVKGYAAERVVSDAASWNCTISFNDMSPQRAVAKTRADCATAVNFFKAAGISEGEIETGAITISEIKKKNSEGNDTNEIAGYSAQVRISVSSGNIKTVETLFKRSGELVEKGVMIWADVPQYFYTNIEALKINLIGKATINARERALKLTESGGGKLGAIVSASQGVFQITQPLSTETSSYGVYETGTVEKDVKCIVNVEFAIER